jgi:hypothetical protein
MLGHRGRRSHGKRGFNRDCFKQEPARGGTRPAEQPLTSRGVNPFGLMQSVEIRIRPADSH